MDLVDQMLEHDHWATNSLLDVCRTLPDEQLDQQFDIGHRTIRVTLAHLILNTGFWTALMAGQAPETRHDDCSLTAMTDWYEQTFTTFATFARRARDEQRLADTFIDHYDAKKSVGGTILHVVLHNAEHRTEILHILERLGVPEVPEIDLGLWDYEMLNT